MQQMPTDTHRDFKNRLYAQFARIGKATASPARLEILDLLSQGENFQGGIAATAEEDTDHGEDGEDEFGHERTLVTCRNRALGSRLILSAIR